MERARSGLRGESGESEPEEECDDEEGEDSPENESKSEGCWALASSSSHGVVELNVGGERMS